jgi:hypothetical protein
MESGKVFFEKCSEINKISKKVVKNEGKRYD